MTRLSWDSREYAIGVDRCVYYPQAAPGEAWSGIISVNETPVESTQRVSYQEGLRTSQGQSKGYFAGTLDAYSYPASFYSDILPQKRPTSFGMSYRTMTKTHYQIHLVYNVLLAPAGYVHQQSIVETYSWGFTTLPIEVPGSAKASHLVIETSIAYDWVVSALEDILYGTEGDDARLPLPQEIWDLFEANGILRIFDNGDGTWTAETDQPGIISMLDADTFEITWPSAVFITADSYRISTL